MKQPNLEVKINTTEKGPSNYDLLMKKIERTIASTPQEKNKKEHLFETLSACYGKEFSQEIVSSLPSDFFDEEEGVEQKEEIIIPSVEKENEVEVEEEKETENRIDLKNIILETTLRNEYRVSKDKINEIIKNPKLKKYLKIGIYSAITMATSIGILETIDFKKSDKKKTDPQEQEGKFIEKKDTLDKTISFGKRFNSELYTSLPTEGKDVYKYMAEKNPTPSRGYQFLDKENATVYIFNSQNELVAKIPAGFGEDEGDSPNTSVEYKKGNRTTPSGIYLFSNFTTESDIKEYGKLQFSLMGKSILGDTTYLGQHQTYSNHEEFEPRTRKLNSPSPSDNKFSDGCINIREDDFKKYIAPNFKGDYGEFLFILQDKKSKESGAKFEVSALVQEIIPMMIEMANREMETYTKSIPEIKNSINNLTSDLTDLENEQIRLVAEYKKDPKNSTKQRKIEEVKIIIKQKKGELGKLRDFFSKMERKIKEVKIKRDSIEKILINTN